MARASFLSVPLWFKTLILRFSPLWIALFIALLLPPSREMLRFHIVSSEIAPQLYNWGQPWDSYGDDLDPGPFLKKEPENAALALWNMWYQTESQYDDDDSYGYAGASGNSQQLQALSEKFPAEIWLKGYALRAYMAERFIRANNAMGMPAPPVIAPAPVPPSGLKPFPVPMKAVLKIPDDQYLLVQSGAKSEPDNAFWPVCEAHFRALESNYDAAKRLLARAARCTFYDDKSLETARRLIEVQSRFRSLSWEEKKVLYEDANEESNFLPSLTEPIQNLSTHFLQKDDFDLKLQTCVSLMRVGALMQRGNNSLDTCREGMKWQSLAWRLGTPKAKPGQLLPNAHRLFGAEVQKRGYPAIAREALRLKRESDVLQLWMNQSNNESWGYTPVYLNAGGLAVRANSARDTGMILVSFFGYLILWWSFLNVFLFRGQGVASTRRERIVPVLLFETIFIALGLYVAWWFSLIWNGTTPRSPNRDELFTTIGLFAFFGLPFVLGAFCALATMRRFKNEFTLPPRVDLELQLTSFQRAFLRYLLPMLALGSVVLLIGGWLLFALAVIFDWGMINVLGLLPPDRNGVTGELIFHPVQQPIPLIYGIFMCAVCLGVWFVKWRFFSPAPLKRFTHTGLRRWKETIGIAIVSVVWLYVILAVGLWPARRELGQRMDQILLRGPLSQAPFSQAPFSKVPKSGSNTA